MRLFTGLIISSLSATGGFILLVFILSTHISVAEIDLSLERIVQWSNEITGKNGWSQPDIDLEHYPYFIQFYWPTSRLLLVFQKGQSGWDFIMAYQAQKSPEEVLEEWRQEFIKDCEKYQRRRWNWREDPEELFL